MEGKRESDGDTHWLIIIPLLQIAALSLVGLIKFVHFNG